MSELNAEDFAEINLPPLPKPMGKVRTGGLTEEDAYTAEQMRAYALQAQRDTDREARQKVAVALGMGRSIKFSFAWEYLLGIIEECAKDDDDAQQPAQSASIDSTMFRDMLYRYKKAPTVEKTLEECAKVIAYIDARRAAVSTTGDGIPGYTAHSPDCTNRGCTGCFDPDELARLTAPVSTTGDAPEGWKLVPVEPTPAMLKEIKLMEGFTDQALSTRYRAMLAAAPQSPTEEA